MDQINDDCILEIIKYLKIKDEISLVQVSQRFKQLIEPIWARRYNELGINLYDESLSPQEIRVFLENICERTRIVNLRFVTAEVFNVFTEFTFLKAVEFKFSQMPPLFLNDNDILTMQASFPNLRTFSPHGNFTGKYFLRWTKLENVTLSFCRLLQLNHFRDIVRQLPLKSLSLDIFPSINTSIEPLNGEFSLCFSKLENMLVNSYEFNWIAQNMNPFNNLKQLTIMDGIEIDDVYFWLRKFKADDVIELETQHSGIEEYFEGTRPLQLDIFVNLTKLKIIAHPNARTLVDMVRMLNSGHLLALRELFLFGCIMVEESDITDFLKCNHRIEVVSFEQCRMEFPILRLIVRDIIHVERTRPLRVNFFANSVAPSMADEDLVLMQLDIVGTSDLLHVTNNQIVLPSFKPLFIVFK